MILSTNDIIPNEGVKLDKIQQLITFIEKLEIEYDENFKSLEYKISNSMKKLLLNHDFWNKFNKKSEQKRFILVINFINTNTNEEFSLKIDERLELYLPSEEEFINKIMNFVNLIEENDDFLDIKDFNALQKAIKNEIINLEDYKITELTLSFIKDEISDYILSKYAIPKFYKFIFWTSLEKFNKHMKNASLKSLSVNLIEVNKIIAIIVPDNDKIFSNFFEIYSINKINEINKDFELIKSKVDSISQLILGFKKETIFVDEAPIFPINFDLFNRNHLIDDYWLSYLRILIYSIYSLISNKVHIKHHEKKEFFEFHFGRYQKQTLNFTYDKDSNITVNEIKNSTHKFKYEKEDIIEMLTTLTISNYFTGIGEEKNIRDICIERILSPQINNLFDLVGNYENLIDAQNKLKKDLISDRIDQINESYEYIDSILSKSASEISLATTKITQEITKSFLTLIGSTLVTLFGWYLKFANPDFAVPDWFYQILSPVIGLVFVIFFLMLIVSTKMGVVSQVRIFKQSRSDLIDKIGVRVNVEIENNLWNNLKTFNVYFGIITSISIFFILSIISVIIILNRS